MKSRFIHPIPILFNIAQKSVEDQEKYLSYIKCKFGDDILNKLISDETLHYNCSQILRFDDFGTKVLKYFDLIERIFSIDPLKSSISFKGEDNRTFLFYLHLNADRDLIEILSYLFEKFENQKGFLEQLLRSVDRNGDTFLIHYFVQVRTDKMISICKEFLNLIKNNFGLNFLENFLLIRNKKHQNFHHVLLQNGFGGVEESLHVLGILLEVVGKDKEFFVELTKQNNETPHEFKEFLESNF
jgi:hypothetical protein